MQEMSAVLVLILGLNACQRPAAEPAGPAQFQLLEKAQTGLEFQNVLKQSVEFNVFAYMYFFNGGGVAAGDVNQDGRVDLYFTSNMGPNKLFLNEGGMHFRDVTEAAGVAGQEGWTSGTSMVDINGDGLLDIFVSQVGNFGVIQGRNQFYICQGLKEGVPIYEDKAAEYGLDFSGFATQSAFVDYDRDGDLDVFLLNHSIHQNGTFGRRADFQDKQSEVSGDRLLRNDSEGDAIHFTDVTTGAGIYSTAIGYGLGIVVGDINLDGWPDIYVGNDFHENDYLYLNQQNGTFREALTEQMMHTSRFSMGVDMADINNDGWSEVVSLDMLPYDPYILKTSLGEDGFNIFRFKIGYGYNHQYARNNLQLNNGDGTFSEIGMYAGIYATDWSWTSLLFDFDQDGWKDLFISNGIPRRMNDIDYVNFRLGDEDVEWKTDNNFLATEELSIVKKIPQAKIPNKFYHNNGDLTFSDLAGRIRGDRPTYSNGAAYADLDNDGDLDVVVNNIDDAPFIYQNLTRDQDSIAGNYLSISFRGAPQNPLAIGARIIVWKGESRLVAEHFLTRGFQSSVAPGLMIGLGDTSDIRQIAVIWPDGTTEALSGLKYNQLNPLTWREGLPAFDFASLRNKTAPDARMKDITADAGLDFMHQENPFVEFNREGLMPYMVSSEGPALAVGDVNGDGREDVFIGSAKREQSALFLQGADGVFYNATPATILADSLFEDVDAVFADLENDGDLDLVIAAGGNEYRGEAEARIQRAYLNDGKGNFVRKDLFPGVYLTASCMLPGDFTGDGFVDFFIGGRAVPNEYGIIPPSYLMRNRGDGSFEEVTAVYSEALSHAGLVKDGAWQDMDGDGDLDLLLAVEWQPLQLYLNEGDHFRREDLNDLSGWWNFALPYDFDGDGDIDILAGNLGENARFRPTKEDPLRMYVADFDDNGQIEQVLTYYLGGQEIPFANHAELIKQMAPLKKKYLYAKDLALASMADVFGKSRLEKAMKFEANFLQSAYFENTGNGQYTTHVLPRELQFSTLESACVRDPEHPGSVMVGGNFYDSNIEMGRYDASYGHLLSIGPNGALSASPLGIASKGQVRRIAQVQIKGQTCYILAKNNDRLQVLQ